MQYIKEGAPRDAQVQYINTVLMQYIKEGAPRDEEV
jgi:hypothetical protein